MDQISEQIIIKHYNKIITDASCLPSEAVHVASEKVIPNNWKDKLRDKQYSTSGIYGFALLAES